MCFYRPSTYKEACKTLLKVETECLLFVFSSLRFRYGIGEFKEETIINKQQLNNYISITNIVYEIILVYSEAVAHNTMDSLLTTYGEIQYQI